MIILLSVMKNLVYATLILTNPPNVLNPDDIEEDTQQVLAS